METITYNLRDGSGNSDYYYNQIREFSKIVYRYVDSKAEKIITEYAFFLNDNQIEALRSRGEYAVEMLTLGMTWQRYLGAAQMIPAFILKLLIKLYHWRISNQKLKPCIDKVRGWMSGHFMTSKIGKSARNKRYTLKNFRILLLWLKASGEFKDEVKRLSNWYQLCEQAGKEKTEQIIGISIHLIRWFSWVAQEELGCYTTKLNGFLIRKHPEYRYREDEIFTGKEPVEYYLNMVGSEIMNWGFEEGYQQTKRTVILVPGCMSSPNNSKCQAKNEGLDIICQHCSDQCRIGQLNKLGQKNNFEVRIVPHSSSYTAWLKRWQKNPGVGLVAVACLLNLVPGGYEMRELGLNAQCVLLDYCGCKKHWHPAGFPTDLNVNRLLELCSIREEAEKETEHIAI
jgi:hypothetical protein